MILRKGVLKSFNSGAYTATVQLASSYKAYLEDVAWLGTYQRQRWLWAER